MTDPANAPHTPAQIRGLVRDILDREALPPIVQAGHPVLRARALPVDGQLEPEELAGLIDLMRSVMCEAPGVGLAAPQIGVPLQLAVLEDLYDVADDIAAERDRRPLPFFAMLNPRYEPLGTTRALFYEGCLSVTGWQAVVDRPAAVRLAYMNDAGTHLSRDFTGWQARIVAHETDHLAGTLYLDKAISRSFTSNAEYAGHWAQPGIAEARAGLQF
ncbi:peptide deformylase [Specibacter cremeus]|uniref:peptide deformylase n=1 Tax=Specibacter cremeus TaxID=1629051 RepID=UPI000F775E9E|nr:peptide deformylase [Specibacter cremeus]